MGIEFGKILVPGLYIGLAPIVVTFILGTLYNVYLGVESKGQIDKEAVQAKTAVFVNSTFFTALTWAALALMAFFETQGLKPQVAAGTLLVNGLAAAVVGMIIKTVVEVVGWKHDDMKRYWTLTAIQAVLALAAAALGALLAG